MIVGLCLCSEILFRDGNEIIFCSACCNVYSKRIKMWCLSVIELIHCLCMQILQNNSFISHAKACELLQWSVYTQLLVFMVVQNSISSNGEEKTRIIFGLLLSIMHYPLWMFSRSFFLSFHHWKAVWLLAFFVVW